MTSLCSVQKADGAITAQALLELREQPRVGLDQWNLSTSKPSASGSWESDAGAEEGFGTWVVPWSLPGPQRVAQRCRRLMLESVGRFPIWLFTKCSDHLRGAGTLSPAACPEVEACGMNHITGWLSQHLKTWSWLLVEVVTKRQPSRWQPTPWHLQGCAGAWADKVERGWFPEWIILLPTLAFARILLLHFAV